MKKIVCLIDSLVSGGAQRQLVGLACLLKENGFDVSVMTYHNILFYARQLENGNVPYVVVEKASNPAKRFYYISKALKECKPDIVIAYLDVPCIVAVISKFLGCNYKLIVSERNTTQKLNVMERIKFFLYRFANAIVPNSYSQTEFIRKHYPNLASKVYTITNFVDTSSFTPCNHRAYSRTKTLNILSVGRVSEQKNILRYIEAINIVRLKGIDVQVKWFGGKFKEYYDNCINKIQEYHLDKVFTFYDASENIVKEYTNADVFCLPSLYEGFPNVICEAMSCGLPILCSNVCDNPNIVKEDLNGILFNPLSVDDIVASILKFHELDLLTRERMGKESRTLAVDKFSSIPFIQKYMSIINSI